MPFDIKAGCTQGNTKAYSHKISVNTLSPTFLANVFQIHLYSAVKHKVSWNLMNEFFFFSEFEGLVSSHVFYALNRQETKDLFCINLSRGTIGLMRVEVREETAA